MKFFKWLWWGPVFSFFDFIEEGGGLVIAMTLLFIFNVKTEQFHNENILLGGMVFIVGVLIAYIIALVDNSQFIFMGVRKDEGDYSDVGNIIIWQVAWWVPQFLLWGAESLENKAFIGIAVLVGYFFIGGGLRARILSKLNNNRK